MLMAISILVKSYVMNIEILKIDNISGKQFIEIPKSLKINYDKVYLKKVGDNLFVIPFHNSWQSMKDSVNQFSEDFMEERHQSENQNRDF
jgi:antitoxin VapB